MRKDTSNDFCLTNSYERNFFLFLSWILKREVSFTTKIQTAHRNTDSYVRNATKLLVPAKIPVGVAKNLSDETCFEDNQAFIIFHPYQISTSLQEQQWTTSTTTPNNTTNLINNSLLPPRLLIIAVAIAFAAREARSTAPMEVRDSVIHILHHHFIPSQLIPRQHSRSHIQLRIHTLNRRQLRLLLSRLMKHARTLLRYVFTKLSLLHVLYPLSNVNYT